MIRPAEEGCRISRHPVLIRTPLGEAASHFSKAGQAGWMARAMKNEKSTHIPRLTMTKTANT
jgi:hypothetical protein